MKLELKHLAVYLPYDLPISYEYKVDKNKYTGLLVLKGLEKLGKEHNLLLFSGTTLHIKFCKPILRNLSDLTKEIEVNGVKFVPLVELLKTAGYESYKHSDISGSPISGYYKLKGSHFTLEFEFEFDSLHKMFLMKHNNVFSTVKQLNCFQKLYSWLFDLDNLIGNNLAIDINTLSK